MNDIHPTAVIEGSVRMGSGNVVGPFVVVRGPVEIGDGNWFGAGAVVGAPPEVRSFEHPGLSAESAGGGVVIGSRTVVREGAQIHQGWKGVTTVGDDAFVMNQSYVAHDCVLEDGVTLASSVLLAGHVHVGAGANLGLGTTVHQTRTIGRGAMVGMGSVVTRDLPPFSKSWGSPARVVSANVVGMRRAGHEEAVVTALAAAYETGRTAPDDLRELGLAHLLSS
jgi:UDP-N-acetylglucosamine acyltransferase